MNDSYWHFFYINRRNRFLVCLFLYWNFDRANIFFHFIFFYFQNQMYWILRVVAHPSAKNYKMFVNFISSSANWHRASRNTWTNHSTQANERKYDSFWYWHWPFAIDFLLFWLQNFDYASSKNMFTFLSIFLSFHRLIWKGKKYQRFYVICFRVNLSKLQTSI